MERLTVTPMQVLSDTGRFAAHVVIRAYQLTLSAIAGTHCRHLPTCSEYMDEAIARHGLWAGGAMGIARFCRCHPWGTAGFDPVPNTLPSRARWWRPWTYAARVHDGQQVEE
jgi:putative membrane protein insertion efficiency factor